MAAFRHAFPPEKVLSNPEYFINVFCVHDGPKPANNPFREFTRIKSEGKLRKDAAGWGRGARPQGAEDEESVEILDNEDDAQNPFANAVDRSEGADTEVAEDRFDNLSFLEIDALFGLEYGTVEEVKVPASRGGSRAAKQPLPEAMIGIGERPRGRFGCVMISKYNTALANAVEAQIKKICSEYEEE